MCSWVNSLMVCCWGVWLCSSGRLFSEFFMMNWILLVCLVLLVWIVVLMVFRVWVGNVWFILLLVVSRCCRMC